MKTTWTLSPALIHHAALLAGLLVSICACSDDRSGTGASANAPVVDGKLADVAQKVNCGPSVVPRSIRVCGRNLVDAHGDTVQLRGVNVGGLDGVAIQGWSPANPWGGGTGSPTPDWDTIKTWGANAVRLTLNEASWLGLNCIDNNGVGKTVVHGVQRQNAPGTAIKADPGGNYQATVVKSVADATAAGLFVILDLHLSAPGDACPMIQNAMADTDHSIAFWTSLATVFKASPNVLFELFNEPFLDQSSLEKSDPWAALLDGNGTLRSYRVPGKPDAIDYTWHNAGMQQMLDAVRATGAKNVILTSTLAYSSSMGGWLQYHPSDTLNPSQVGAAWHAYPADAKYPAQVNCIGVPACSAQTMAAVQAILAAGYPVVLTEFGDPVGGSAAPMSSLVLPFADSNGISYLAWTWNVWPGTPFYLISDAAGTPTAGFGTYVKAHYLCRAAGTGVCP